MFEESAYHVYISTIEGSAYDILTTAPPRLASTNGGPLAAQPNPDGTLKPLNTSYQAIARLDNPQGSLRNGLIGQARVEATPRTLFWRLMRYLGRTFNFDI
jgi:putative peptide zinc metalloprotease protein